jgi:hypothetical protein
MRRMRFFTKTNQIKKKLKLKITKKKLKLRPLLILIFGQTI